jgi:hypothetical protein
MRAFRLVIVGPDDNLASGHQEEREFASFRIVFGLRNTPDLQFGDGGASGRPVEQQALFFGRSARPSLYGYAAIDWAWSMRKRTKGLGLGARKLFLCLELILGTL